MPTSVATVSTSIEISKGAASKIILGSRASFIEVKSIDRKITLSSTGKQGTPGAGFPGGGLTRQVLTKATDISFDTLWTYDWSILKDNVKYISATPTLVTGGRVFTGIVTGLGTVYRYITNDKTGLYPTEDSFYSGFTGGVLDGLLATRG